MMTWNRQGKCTRCRVRWVWHGAPAPRLAVCPACWRKLQRTTHLLTWPVRWARGRGRPRELEAFTWGDLLRLDPQAAERDVQRKARKHWDREHAGAIGYSMSCATCRVLLREVEQARFGIARRA